ncbi:MAG: hypothetical protein QM589_05055 [Thermomicrobiales bacterium]
MTGFPEELERMRNALPATYHQQFLPGFPRIDHWQQRRFSSITVPVLLTNVKENWMGERREFT